MKFESIKNACRFLFSNENIVFTLFCGFLLTVVPFAMLSRCELDRKRAAETRFVLPCPDGSEVEVRVRQFEVKRTTWEDVEGNELFRQESVYEVAREKKGKQ